MRKFEIKKPFEAATAAVRGNYVFIDALLFFVIWNVVTSVFRVKLPFSVMQRYTPTDYENYLTVMTYMTIILFFISLISHWVFGASFGKLIFGYRTVQLDGQKLNLVQSFLRSLILFFIALLILAPGPLIAFIFGPGSEIDSVLALLAGLILWLTITFAPLGGRLPHANGQRRTLLERWLGAMTVRVARAKS